MEQQTHHRQSAIEQNRVFLWTAVEKQNVPSSDHARAAVEALKRWNEMARPHPAEATAVIQFDIPRKLWMDKLANAGQNPEIATNDHFTVGHVYISRSADAVPICAHLRQLVKQFGFMLLFESTRPTSDESVLFWQIAMLPSDVFSLSDRLFRLAAAMERITHVRVASLSHVHVIYESAARNGLLGEPDLSHPFLASASTFAYIGRAGAPLRYTRLGSAGLLVHSAETPAPLIEPLVYDHGYSLLEAARLTFMPSEAKQQPKQKYSLFVASFDHEAIWMTNAADTLWKTDSSARIVIATEPYGDAAQPLAAGQPLALTRSVGGQPKWLDALRLEREVSVRLPNRRTVHVPTAF
ncbi:glutamate synthase [Geobacillus jurassicus]|uniref:Glutamate synthase n=3 Tax=Geobacillus jurassicus TaxID=235932 RepID=A0ABV6GX86_9BACL|nr:glutamate synthase [Geobacillus jurassicus]